MHVFEDIFGNDVVQVCFHELKDQVNVFVVVCPECVVEFYYVGMFGLFEDLNLAVGALGVGRVLEGVEDFFKCKYFFGGLFLYFPDMPVGPRAYFFDHVEPPQNMGLDVGGVRLGHGNGLVNNKSVIKLVYFINAHIQKHLLASDNILLFS